MDRTASEEEEEEEKEVVQCGKTQKSAPPLRDSERMQIRENVVTFHGAMPVAL